MIAVLNGQAIVGDRTTLVETIDGRARRFSISAEARRRGVTQAQLRRDYIQREIGSVPARTDYDGFLRRQSTTYQDSVLGQRKGQLFREGLHLNQYVDATGRELTIGQLENLL